MPFELIEALSAPGNPAKPNDDAWSFAGALAVVFDGATSLGGRLMPGESDAAWLAGFAAERVAAHAAGMGAREALEAAAVDAEVAFARLRARPPAEGWEVPYASMMLVEAVDGGGLEAFWFGDCAALVLRPGEACEPVGDAFGRRIAEAASASRLAAAHGRAPASASVAEAFLPTLRAGRSRYNSAEEGPWIFGPMRACAGRAKRGSARAPAGALVLLASDGFLALATDYRRYDAGGLVAAARERGLRLLLDELRAIERDDPDGQRHARFKTSDDATAVLLRVTSAGV